MLAKGFYEEQQQPEQIKAVKFELYRAEGPSRLCGPAPIVTTWKEADDILRSWALTVTHGGSDKCDFTVTWQDGETYTGRYSLKCHDSSFYELLGRHIREYLKFHTGTLEPDWLTPQQYKHALNGVNCNEYTAFLEAYEIGGELPAHVEPYTPAPKPQPMKPSYIKTNPAELPTAKPIQARNLIYFGIERYNADIWPGIGIRLFGTYKNRTEPEPYDIYFKIGDKAEYDSYNFSYDGEIVSITAKTVTIDKGHSEKKCRLDIAKFASKNWDYSPERIASEYANWYD